ncbi:Het-eN [Dactylonectria macrodidyma]|uniref:Het-eN n=1 Tax=Dactylonectria macrodidyma TaxID=307937 RepID=A0A9P9FTG2_9HYPO|nr:Het-eN [Dactylonectria macrodidyma]
MDDAFNDINVPTKGTCEWLRGHEEYNRWAASDHGLLHIAGGAGSGKSTLLRHVLANIMSMPNVKEDDVILSFFFYGRGTKLQRSPTGFIRSLLCQLLNQAPELLGDIVDAFPEHIGSASGEFVDTRLLRMWLQLSFEKVAQRRPTWLFVDALDECEEDDSLARTVITFLLEDAPFMNQVHVCVTGRQPPTQLTAVTSSLRMETQNSQDVSTFVQDKLHRFQSRSTIASFIALRAEGSFLWARSMTERISTLCEPGVDPAVVKARILTAPLQLDDLYGELTKAMEPDALRIICWIRFAIRPLSLSELRWVIAVEANPSYQSLHECQSAAGYIADDEMLRKRVQVLTYGLAEINPQTNVAQFTHASIKDYFIRDGLVAMDGRGQAALHRRVKNTQHQIMRTCLRYLAMYEIGQAMSDSHDHLTSMFPFLEYAATSWVKHIPEGRRASEDLLVLLNWPSNVLVTRWVLLCHTTLDPPSCPPEGINLVHILLKIRARSALEAVLKRVDEIGVIVKADAQNILGQTPLSWAAAEGNGVILRLLLESGANPAAADDDGRTPLSWASERGSKTDVQLLLDRGADVQAADLRGQTPLSFAARQGHSAICTCSSVSVLMEEPTEAVSHWDMISRRRTCLHQRRYCQPPGKATVMSLACFLTGELISRRKRCKGRPHCCWPPFEGISMSCSFYLDKAVP